MLTVRTTPEFKILKIKKLCPSGLKNSEKIFLALVFWGFFFSQDMQSFFKNLLGLVSRSMDS